jgi:hypothetical protein
VEEQEEQDLETCTWCMNKRDDCKRTALGLVCPRCIRAIESRGEEIT